MLSTKESRLTTIMALSTVAMLGALGSFVSHLTESPLRAGVSLVLLCLSVYLFHVNRLLSGTPEEVRRLSPHRWTRNQIRAAYRTLEQRPITTESFAGQVPPKLERRYIVTGGSGRSIACHETLWGSNPT